MCRYSEVFCGFLLLGSATLCAAQSTSDSGLKAIGRPATTDEVKAWDIDVRSDFKGLPKGKGDVALGEGIWEAKCASCHGAFGESNDVFTPIAGGTTSDDIKTGRVQNLAQGGYPHRTTLMKVSKLSTLWDYISRAMPWNEPKSLTPDEVYGVLAYILNIGEIIPADFMLSQENMAEVQKLLPNRNGKVLYPGLWETKGDADVTNTACLKDCPVEANAVVALPDAARNTHGNIADQVRPFGPARGTDTASPPRTEVVGVKRAVSTGAPAAPATAPAADASALVTASACTACHGMAQKIVGPGFQEIGRKYDGKADAVDYLSGKILNGGQGVWGPVPMPAQAQLKEDDARTIAKWLAGGAR